jgi:hypothetical protein
MAVKLSSEVRTALAQTIISKIDGGGASGSLKIYDGTKPPGPDTPLTSQNVLSEHTLSYPCGTAANGILTFSAITEDPFANATGTATWARFYDSTGKAIADASITQVGGGGDLEMNTVNIVINGHVRFTSLQWSMPGG